MNGTVPVVRTAAAAAKTVDASVAVAVALTVFVIPGDLLVLTQVVASIAVSLSAVQINEHAAAGIEETAAAAGSCADCVDHDVAVIEIEMVQLLHALD